MSFTATDILVAIVAAVLGGSIVWLLMRARRAADQATLAARAESLRRLEQEVEHWRKRADDRDTASLRTLDQLSATMRERMDALSSTIQRVDTSRVESHAALRQQLTTLAESELRLRGETENLVKALRVPHVRGRWGEMQLRRVVELAGMVENCDFTEQVNLQTPDGRLRPDMVVRLPGGKVVVVDAKAPLDAYLSAVDAADEKSRDGHLDRHVRQIRDHIERLASKDYSAQFSEAPDFVVLFIPGETFFSEACRRDGALIDYAVGMGVIPASPTTLITLLKSVAFGWRQARIEQSAEQLRDLGMELYDRIAKMTEHIAGMGRGISQAVRAYNEAVGSLESRVLPTARRMGELQGSGGRGREEIPALNPVDLATREMGAPELDLGFGKGSQHSTTDMP